VELADWSKRDLLDIDRDVAAKYKLNGRQKRDREAAQQYLEECQKRRSNAASHRKGPINGFFGISNHERFLPDPPLAPMVLKYVVPQKSTKLAKKLHPANKNRVKYQVPVALPCVGQHTTSQEELRRVQLKRQKEWHKNSFQLP